MTFDKSKTDVVEKVNLLMAARQHRDTSVVEGFRWMLAGIALF